MSRDLVEKARKLNETRIEQITSILNQKPTEELLEIWIANDKDTWTDEAFDAIQRILQARGASIPEQEVHTPGKFSSRTRTSQGWAVLELILAIVIFIIAWSLANSIKSVGFVVSDEDSVKALVSGGMYCLGFILLFMGVIGLLRKKPKA